MNSGAWGFSCPFKIAFREDYMLSLANPNYRFALRSSQTAEQNRVYLHNAQTNNHSQLDACSTFCLLLLQKVTGNTMEQHLCLPVQVLLSHLHVSSFMEAFWGTSFSHPDAIERMDEYQSLQSFVVPCQFRKYLE